jgi:hypothetical protein
MAGIFFALMMCMVFIWFALIIFVFKRLKKQHSKIYIQLGSPSLFWNNSIKNNFLFMKFLFMRKYLSLNDVFLKRLMDFMLIFFVIYLMLFIGFSVLVGCS